MELASAITIQDTVTPKTYHVYYNEWNGEIVSISRQLRSDISSPHIVTDSTDCKHIIRGEANVGDFKVSFNSDDILQFMKKSEVLSLRSSSDEMYMVPRVLGNKSSNYDIRIEIYTLSNTLVVRVNSESINRLINMSSRMSLLVDEDSDLDLYLTKYNFPDFFITRLRIPPDDLLINGYVAFDITDVVSKTSLDDLGVLTKRCFKSYNMIFKNERFDDKKHGKRAIGRTYHTNTVKSGAAGHIVLTQIDSHVTISTELSLTELKELGLYTKSLDLHVVGESPDYYYDTIQVNLVELANRKKTKIRCQYDLATCNIVHSKDCVLITLNNGSEIDG